MKMTAERTAGSVQGGNELVVGQPFGGAKGILAKGILAKGILAKGIAAGHERRKMPTGASRLRLVGALLITSLVALILHFTALRPIPSPSGARLVYPQGFDATSGLPIGARGADAYGMPGFDSLVHIAFTSATWDREPFTRNETELLLKSILIHSKCPIHVTIMSDSISADGVEAILRRASLAKKFSYTILPVPYEFVTDTIENEWGIPMIHHEGKGGYAKFLWPQIFPPSVKRVLSLDSDMISGSDICELWGEFNKSKPMTLFHFVPKPFNGFCPCVGLLHLDRMRAAGWLFPGQAPDELAPTAAYGINFTAFFRNYTANDLAGGDQTLFNVLRNHFSVKFPEMLLLLDWSWDLEACENYHRVFPARLSFKGSGVQDPILKDGRLPPFRIQSPSPKLTFKMAHFNCFHGKDRDGTYNEITLRSWGIVWKWIKDYHWDWLNSTENSTSPDP